MSRALASLLLAVPLCAQVVPGASRPVCIYCGTPLPNGVHAARCPYHAPARKPSARPVEPKASLAGTLFQNLLTSLFASDPEPEAPEARAAAEAEAQAAEARQARDEAAQAAYLRMMEAYKPLDGSQGAAFKALSNARLDLKPLDGETLEARARAPFDTPAGPTPFFGDTMPLQDIQFLVNPGNDPRVVDLRKAGRLLVARLRADAPKVEAARKPQVRTPDCARLAQTLEGAVQQRAAFQRTVQASQAQVDIWEAANRAALLKAAQDGMEALTGTVLDAMSQRAEAAGRLERILEREAGRMGKEGLDVAAIRAKIQRLRALSSAGHLLDFTRSLGEWQTFLKDGVSALLAQLEGSNRELAEMFADPRLKAYFGGEAPALNALLDLTKLAASNQVVGKWVARKVPVIAGVELALKEAYNAMDWYLSFQRIAEARAINGTVLAAADAIQKRIDDTFIALEGCHPAPSPQAGGRGLPVPGAE
ncbi:hypothetical protein [Mesoterricola sediminis]|uniref:Uncharacterized protein n=1 Tax=Mesoterricola sediminis TaxID=2927980 RepID=A0AA48KC27_9BACT|nr:hypothetical protein [Mesoterricola sediminis]BDU75665.1 hypothetical protein METESE_06230 [Mesoterricola sediminis]